MTVEARSRAKNDKDDMVGVEIVFVGYGIGIWDFWKVSIEVACRRLYSIGKTGKPIEPSSKD